MSLGPAWPASILAPPRRTPPDRLMTVADVAALFWTIDGRWRN